MHACIVKQQKRLAESKLQWSPPSRTGTKLLVGGQMTVKAPICGTDKLRTGLLCSMF